MKAIFTLGLLACICIIKSCCAGTSCAECPPLPEIRYMSTPIIRFDTTSNSFQASELDTLFLYATENEKLLKKPNDTFLNASNTSVFSGVDLSINLYVSNQSMTRFIKINNLQKTLTKEGKGCCPCNKYALVSININDTTYAINQIPVLVK